jgi:hypothetical protein
VRSEVPRFDGHWSTSHDSRQQESRTGLIPGNIHLYGVKARAASFATCVGSGPTPPPKRPWTTGSQPTDHFPQMTIGPREPGSGPYQKRGLLAGLVWRGVQPRVCPVTGNMQCRVLIAKPYL